MVEAIDSSYQATRANDVNFKFINTILDMRHQTIMDEYLQTLITERVDRLHSQNVDYPAGSHLAGGFHPRPLLQTPFKS